MMILLVILNLGAATRRLLRLPLQEPQMPSDPEKRTPDETAQMARQVMKRMLETPPQPHQAMPKKAKKKSKSRRR